MEDLEMFKYSLINLETGKEVKGSTVEGMDVNQCRALIQKRMIIAIGKGFAVSGDMSGMQFCAVGDSGKYQGKCVPVEETPATEPCRKCGGTGVLYQFHHIQSGVCFRCWNRRIELTKEEHFAAKKAYYETVGTKAK